VKLFKRCISLGEICQEKRVKTETKVRKKIMGDLKGSGIPFGLQQMEGKKKDGRKM